MSFPKKPDPCLFFTGVLFSADTDVRLVQDILRREYGEIRACSRVIPFVWSEYYNKEMGEGLNRIFIVYSELKERDSLVSLKKKADMAESQNMSCGKRLINVDPGFITPENVVLATNKNFFHRIYLGDGVFAEVTLFYRHGTFEHIIYWTFPEYRSSSVIGFFNEMRSAVYG